MSTQDGETSTCLRLAPDGLVSFFLRVTERTHVRGRRSRPSFDFCIGRNGETECEHPGTWDGTAPEPQMSSSSNTPLNRSWDSDLVKAVKEIERREQEERTDARVEQFLTRALEQHQIDWSDASGKWDLIQTSTGFVCNRQNERLIVLASAGTLAPARERSAVVHECEWSIHHDPPTDDWESPVDFSDDAGLWGLHQTEHGLVLHRGAQLLTLDPGEFELILPEIRRYVFTATEWKVRYIPPAGPGIPPSPFSGGIFSGPE